MDIPMGHNPLFGKWFLTDVIHALERYGLIVEGDKVCVALSGGKDSVTLTYVLWYLKNYSHLQFDVCAVHVKIDEYDTAPLREYCEKLSVEYIETPLKVDLRAYPRSPCHVCSSFKRGAIGEALEGRGVRKVAFGHHADDAAETFLMNIAYNRRLASLTPKVMVPEGSFEIIRPMVYLPGPTVKRLHNHLRLPVLDYLCPHGEKSAREVMRTAIARIEETAELREFSRMVVDALENVDYSSLWPSLRV
ncbi:MAG TPA: ATP-binding protein [Deltaproteobacteria bacterium]|nr:ATP-binding protein [Deltaproteobacteria bacterium]HPP79334.1 ATP-binding protein [Deltaproteobacteria bacterium]